MEYLQDLDCRGLTFFNPDGALCFLNRGTNTNEALCILLPILASHAPPYDEVIDWLQFSYTKDWLGAYVYLDSTDLDFTTLSEGGDTLHSVAMASSNFIPR